MKFSTFQKDWTLAILRLILLPNIAVEVHFRTSCYEGLLKLKLKGFSSSGRLELVSGHLGEGLLELLGDPLQLLLLAHQLVLQSVNLNREILISGSICVCVDATLISHFRPFRNPDTVFLLQCLVVSILCLNSFSAFFYFHCGISLQEICTWPPESKTDNIYVKTSLCGAQNTRLQIRPQLPCKIQPHLKVVFFMFGTDFA